MAGRDVLGNQKSLTSYLQEQKSERLQARRRRSDVLGRALDEADASLDVSLEALDGFLQKLLLIVVGLAEDVDGLLSTVGLQGS